MYINKDFPREKGRDMMQSYDSTPKRQTEHSQSTFNTKTVQKCLIIQQLWTNL